MVRCTIYVPVSYNDGSFIPYHVREAIFLDVLHQFGGYTIHPDVRGAYTFTEGQTCVENMTPLDVCVDHARIGEVRALAAAIARTLAQESVYFEVHTSVVHFVTPAE